VKKNKMVTSVFALGGLGEVGKNMYVIEHENELIIIDAGVKFPELELLGIDYVIQDITYLKQNEKKIKGLFITHGHEDHIGGISFLLQNVKIPIIYAPQFAADLIKSRLEERNIKHANIEIYSEKSIIRYHHFIVEFVSTTHSIPDSYLIVIRTPNGIIIYTGDFKFDLTPIGPMANLHKLASLGIQGVRLLLSDSTNALEPGYSSSESIVDEALGDIFLKHNSRIIIATFASNVYRLKHIIETCKKNNRKIVTFGRSMEAAREVALKNGLIKADGELFVSPEKAKDYKKNEICFLCTGSQGEPLAALTRIANGNHKQIELLPDDIVVFSSSPIPGNKASISRIINKLYLKGVRVYTNKILSDIHSSGHANEEELKWMLRLIKPEFFFPVHGEHRMLRAHGDLAMDCDIPEENIFICQNGDVVELSSNGAKIGNRVASGDIYVDGSRVGDIGSVVIKDRQLMSRDGILVTILNINPIKRELLIKPNITTRGFVLVNENAELISKIEEKVSQIVADSMKNKYNYIDLKNQIIFELNPFINELTGRRPIILPVIMEIKTI